MNKEEYLSLYGGKSFQEAFIEDLYRIANANANAFTMQDAFDLLQTKVPITVLIRVIAVQGGNISWFQRIMFAIGMFFLRRSGLHVGERE
jgi:hypothetical protein